MSMFFLFVNGIDCNCDQNKANKVMYADDVRYLFHKISNLNELKNDAATAINNLKSCYDTNGLKFNSEESQCILFGANLEGKAVPTNFSNTIGKFDLSV